MKTLITIVKTSRNLKFLKKKIKTKQLKISMCLTIKNGYYLCNNYTIV